MHVPGDRPGRRAVGDGRRRRPAPCAGAAVEETTLRTALARLHGAGSDRSTGQAFSRAPARQGRPAHLRVPARDATGCGRRTHRTSPRPVSASTGHPLLGAAVELPDSDAVLLTGRLSLRTHPWLADHAVATRSCSPGTALVELAVRAGDEVGCASVEELTLEAHSCCPDRPAPSGCRSTWRRRRTDHRAVSIYAAATERVGAGTPPACCPAASTRPSELTEWPPAGEAVDLDGVVRPARRRRDIATGRRSGGCVRLWRRGDDVFAEVVRPATTTAFSLHPALLDAALHAGWALDGDGLRSCRSRGRTWTCTRPVRIADRVRITRPDRHGRAVCSRTASGSPVASVGSLGDRDRSRPSAADSNRRPLFTVDWVPVPPDQPGDRGSWCCQVRQWSRPSEVAARGSGAVQRCLADDERRGTLVVSDQGCGGRRCRGRRRGPGGRRGMGPGAVGADGAPRPVRARGLRRRPGGVDPRLLDVR